MSALLSLALEYGLLFDLLLVLVDYNIVSVPSFELSSGKLSYPSVALRYQRRL